MNGEVYEALCHGVSRATSGVYNRRMTSTKPQHFPIRFGPIYGALSSALLLPARSAYLEAGPDIISVRMGWAFRARFPRAAVAAASRLDQRPLSLGVHGFGGRWLVNGSTDRLVRIRLDPPQRATVLGIPVSLRELTVSVDDPDAVAACLRSQK